MLARALEKQHTQLLFIPVELMTYFAFSHTPEGIGKSLLEDMKILNSLRSMLMFANVMASLKNSIGRTEVKIKLDESDPNPQKTIETAMHEIIRSRQQYFPLGMNSPTDLTDWLQKSGFEFTFEGHPGLPDVAIDFGEKNSNYIKPDTDLEESLRKRAIMATGLSPDTVDATFQAEFATSIVANNILLSKRVTQMQEQFTPQLANHLRKCIMNSEQLVNDLRKILIDNFDKLEVVKNNKDDISDSESSTIKEHDNTDKNIIINNYLNEFIMNFEVALPIPNSVTLETQMTALETYIKALDTTLDAWISEKFFTTDLGGDVANQVATIKEVLKAYFIRKWMSENGVMTELNSLTTLSNDGEPAIDIYKLQESHIEGLTKSLTRFMFNINKVKESSETVLNSIGGAGEGTSSNQPENTSSSDNSNSDSWSNLPEEETPSWSDMSEEETPKPEEETPEKEPEKEEKTKE
jgi:hypothetical protein